MKLIGKKLSFVDFESDVYFDIKFHNNNDVYF